MKLSSLAIGLIIMAIPAHILIGQVSSFPYSQDFTSNPLAGDWNVSKTGLVSTDWTYSATDGNSGECLKVTGYVTLGGFENYLDLALNTSSSTFTGGETFGYQIFREAGATGNATIVVQQNASGSFVDIAGSSYLVDDLAATTWTTKAETLPSEMQGKSNVKIRLKISGSLSLAFNSLRFDNASVSGGTLPVQMVSLTAVASGSDAHLRWSTANEVNNYGFEIERRGLRAGNESWSIVGFVEGAGISTSPRDYSFVDAQLTPGRHAYRIKQIDNGGAFQYYGGAELEVLPPSEFALDQNYPNPFNPSTEIRFHVAHAQVVVLSIYNLVGQQVATVVNEHLQPGTYTASFDASRLASGSYFYRLQAGEFIQSRKLILQK